MHKHTYTATKRGGPDLSPQLLGSAPYLTQLISQTSEEQRNQLGMVGVPARWEGKRGGSEQYIHTLDTVNR